MATLTSTSAERDTPGRVLPGPLDWSPPEPPRKNWTALVFGPLLVLGVMLFFVSQITLPYVQLAPGGAEPINELLVVPKEHAHPPKGSFLLTTVSLRSTVTPLDLVHDYFDSDIVIIARKDILGGSSQKQYNRQAAQDMNDSKEAALVLAFRTLGYSVPEHGSGALIASMPTDAVPATGFLEPGDVITALDGVPTNLAQEAIGILQKKKPGDSVVATLTADDGTTSQKTVRLGTRANDQSCSTAVIQGGSACLGVVLGTKNHRFDYPFKVSIDTQGVGGPSAGLAFTLALIDELTPGELTGGANVAVTGTVDFDGTVGDVGGVAQKTAAVRHAGAKLFLVPPGEFEEAKQHAGKRLKVVQVTTLPEALAALRANGGDAFELPKPASN